MKFTRGFCGYQGKTDCTPFDDWHLEFTNPIDSAGFDKSLVKIEPAVEGLRIYPSGNYISIQGYKPGRRTYKVTVESGVVKDTFGQNLSNPATATFKVGSAPASLTAQGGNFVILDPTAKPNYSVYSINQPSLKVQVRAVTPEDWETFRQYMRFLHNDDQKRPALPGRIVFDQTVQVENKPDELVETRLDLSPALSEGFGHAIVFVEPTVKRDKYDRTKIVTWAQATQIGLDAFIDNAELVGFATDLRTGKPLAGVEMRIFPTNGTPISQHSTINNQQGIDERTWADWLASLVSTSGPNAEGEPAETSETPEIESNENAQTGSRTAANGLLRLALPESQPKQSVLIARKGKDTAFLPENSDYYWQDSGSWFKRNQPDSLRWFVFDDRQMYRPKEEVSVKGYVRVLQGGKFGDVAALADSARGLTYVVRDARGNEITKGDALLNAFGAFDFKFKLPDNANLGYSQIELRTQSNLSGNYHSHGFQIQEFRRPEFEVSAKNETEAPYIVGGSANV
ncbi:MAG TPA: MG2 domain-containing protein, partial [Pyrinomonadaceae bacterium]|nr:MG2 domain-containing protein [Pyrinomonadaceae bacterium]